MDPSLAPRLRARLCAGLALILLAGCGTSGAWSTATAVHATPVRVTGTAAGCANLTPAEQFALARLVFVGRMPPGPTAHVGARSVLVSPARMRVTRYLKGRGPARVTVQTAVIASSGAAETVAEDGIDPRAGERWKIYVRSGRQPFATSACLGSARVPVTRGRAGRGG